MEFQYNEEVQSRLEEAVIHLMRESYPDEDEFYLEEEIRKVCRVADFPKIINTIMTLEYKDDDEETFCDQFADIITEEYECSVREQFPVMKMEHYNCLRMVFFVALLTCKTLINPPQDTEHDEDMDELIEKIKSMEALEAEKKDQSD